MISQVLPTYARAPLSFVEGKGPWLIDQAGEHYFDFGAGIAVNALGHANPVLVKALEEQARHLWHVSNLYTIPRQEELAKLLVENSFADTVFFTNSGTESIECAVKMVRKYFYEKGASEKHRIITFEGAFHGRSSAGIAASKGEKMVKGFGPLLPGFDQVPFGDLAAVEAAITEETAAILIEPIQGEGGIRPTPPGFLKALRGLCDQKGLLLVLDEIQCGVGRTGRLFAHEWEGITPDIMAVAKGIGGGFPLGACLATEDAASGMVAGTHGSTYGGNPLGCAIGLAVLHEILSDGFLEHVNALAAYANQKLGGLIDAHPTVFDSLRGAGLMLGIKCVKSNLDIVKAGYEQKLLVVPAGDNIIRLMPPLNLTFEEFDAGFERLEATAYAIEAHS